MLASARLPVTRPRCVSLAVLLWLPGIILLVPKEELAGVSLQVLILGPLSVSALWVRKHPDTKCRDGWRASVLYLDSLGYCCRFCAKQIKDYKQPGRIVLKRPWNMSHIGQHLHALCQMSSLTRWLNRDFILVHQTFRIALSWHYLWWYCIWVILTNIFMLVRDIISARWAR